MRISSTVDQIAREKAHLALLESRKAARAQLDKYDQDTPIPGNPERAAKMQKALLSAYAQLNDPKLAQDEYDKIYVDFINHARSLPEPKLPRPPSPRAFRPPPLVPNSWWRCINPFDSLTDWDESNRRTKAAWEDFQKRSEQRTKKYEKELTEAYAQAFGQ